MCRKMSKENYCPSEIMNEKISLCCCKIVQGDNCIMQKRKAYEKEEF